MPRNYVHEKYQHPHDADMARLYQEGLTAKQIGKMYGVSSKPVYQALQRQGVKLRPAGKIPTWTGSDEQRRSVADLYAAGESVRSIAKRLACRTSIVIDALEEAGIERRPAGAKIRALTDEQAEEVKAIYASGVPTTKIAEQYGTTATTVRNYLVAQGVVLRTGGSAFSDGSEKVKAAKMYAAGLSQQKIAENFGVKQATVSRWFMSMGIQPLVPRARREAHGSWRGGRHIDGGGYVRVKVPAADAHLIPAPLSGDYVLEHRLVMARALGRPLAQSETVHHVNGNKQDNRLENLQLRQGKHGVGVQVQCLDCGSHNVEAVPLS